MHIIQPLSVTPNYQTRTLYSMKITPNDDVGAIVTSQRNSSLSIPTIEHIPVNMSTLKSYSSLLVVGHSYITATTLSRECSEDVH